MDAECSAKSKSRLSLKDTDEIAKWLLEIVEGPMHESPIDVNIGNAIEIDLPPLVWHNFDLIPKKMKLTNTGHTIILSGKWYQERPYLTGGPLLGSYVFSQLHLHWGENDMEGSEHGVDGQRFPMEVHVILFRSCYLTQESALKERDGIIILVYLYKMEKYNNPVISKLAEKISGCTKPFTSTRIHPMLLTELITSFSQDYFAYWGTTSTKECTHYILWLICRKPNQLKSGQLVPFRKLVAINDKPMRKNCRTIQPSRNRKFFHVCPSNICKSTLFPS